MPQTRRPLPSAPRGASRGRQRPVNLEETGEGERDAAGASSLLVCDGRGRLVFDRRRGRAAVLSVSEFLEGLAVILMELLVWLKPFYGSDRDDAETWFSAYRRSSQKQDEAEGDFY